MAKQILLIDESRVSTNKLRAELEKLSYTVHQVKSRDELDAHLFLYKVYDIILVEQDFPLEKEGEPKRIGFDIAKEMCQRFPLAKVLFFVGNDETKDGIEAESIYRILKRPESLAELIREIQSAGHATMEDKLHFAQQQLDQINRIATALLEKKSEQEILDIVVEGVFELGYDRVRLYLVSEDEKRLIGKAQEGMEGNGEEFFASEWQVEDIEYEVELNGRIHPKLFRRTQDKDAIDYEKKVGRKSVDEWVTMPLYVNGRLIGKISADNKYTTRQIQPEELIALMGIANQAAIAINKIRLKDQESQKKHLLQVIHNVAIEISQLGDSHNVFPAISRAVVELFDAVEHSGLVIFYNNNSYGKLVAQYPASAQETDIKIPLKDIQLEEELINGAPYVISEDVVHDKRLGEVRDVLAELAIKSVVFIPIRHNNKLLGSFSLDAIASKHIFTEEEIELAQIFAAHIAPAIANIQRVSELEALNQFALTMSQITDPHELLNVAVIHTVKLLNGRRGGIHLIDQDKGIIQLVADQNKISPNNAVLQLNEGMAGQMLKHKKDCMISANYADESYASAAFQKERTYEALIKVVLRHADEPIGFLYVEDELGREFSQEDAEKLMLFGTHVGNAVYQTKLLHQQSKLANDLQILHLIGDIIEPASKIKEVINFALIGLTAEYALAFDRAAFFLLDKKNPEILRGKAGYGHFEIKDWESQQAWLREQGIINFPAHTTAYKQDRLKPTALNDPIRNISIDLNQPDAQKINELLAIENTRYSVDDHSEIINAFPKRIKRLFKADCPRVIVALVDNYQKLGILILENTFSKNSPDKPHLKALKTFARSTAFAINRIHLKQKADHQNKNFRSFFEFSQEHAGRQDTQKIIKAIIDKIKEVSGADAVSFIRVNIEHLVPKKDHLWAPKLLYSTMKKYADPVEWMRLDGNSVEVLNNAVPLIREDTSDFESELKYSRQTLGMEAVVCLPAIAAQKKLGVVWLYFQKKRPFYQPDIDEWQLFVNQAASIYLSQSDFDRLAAEKRLSEGVQEMVVAKDITNIYKQILKQAYVVLEERRPFVTLYSFDTNRHQMKFVGVEPQNPPFQPQFPENLHDELKAISEQNKIINRSIYPSVQRDKGELNFDWKQLLPHQKFDAVSFLPLRWNNNDLGIMVVGYEIPQPFSDSQNNALERLADFASVAIHNAQELSSKQLEIDKFHAITDINQLVVNPNDPKILFKIMVRRVWEFMDEHNRAPLFCDLRLREGKWLRVKASYPRHPDLNLRKIDLTKESPSIGLTGSSFKRGEVIEEPDVSSNYEFLNVSEKVRSELVVPIQIRDHTIGVLNLEFEEKSGFTKEDVNLVKAFASRIAGVVVRAHAVNQQSAFHEASKIIATAITDDYESQTDQILEQVVTVFQPLSGSLLNQAAVHFYDEKDDVIYMENIFPKNDDSLQMNVGKEKSGRILNSNAERIGITGRVTRTGIAEFVNDVAKDRDYVGTNPKTKSEMAVPLSYEGKVIGAFSIQSEQKNAFMQEDLNGFETFAELVTIVRKIGERYSQLMDARTRVEAVTALALLGMISATWQHSNRSRAITIRDRAKLLRDDIRSGDLENVEQHIQVIHEATQGITRQKISSNITNPEDSFAQSLKNIIVGYAKKKNEKRAHPNGLRIDLKLEEDANTLVRVQPVWIIELLDIFYNNAVAALNKTAVPCMVIQSMIDKPANVYELEITDNGPGFPPKILNHLFQKQISKERHEVGSGVGLLLARIIVESFGGRIEGKNCPNGGSFIKISFPIDSSDE